MKQKSLIVRNGMAILLAVLLVACLSLGITTSFANASDAQTAAESEPAITYVLGSYGAETADTIYFRNQAEGWAAAIAKAVELGNDQNATNKLVKIKFARDWTVKDSFGEDSRDVRPADYAFRNGGLSVPAKANVIIDLNGYVLTRNLKDKELKDSVNGSVLYLNGTVEIIDSRPTSTHSVEYSYGEEENKTVINGGIITGGKSFYGGAIYSTGKVTLSGGTLYGNQAGEYGGAVYVAPNSVFTMNGGAIVGNETYEYEYTITVGEPDETETPDESESGEEGISAYAITEENVTTAGFGGAIATTPTDVNTNAVININGGTIAYNNAVDGGAIYVAAATMNVTGGSISNNVATNNGGAIVVAGGRSINISDCVIENNVAGMNGGAISVRNAKVLVAVNDNSEDSEDAEDNYQYLDTVSFVIDNSNIANNSAAEKGGALDIGSKCTVKLEGCEIESNTASIGGAINISGGKTELKNVVISDNTSDDGIVYVASSSGLTLTVLGGEIVENDGVAICVSNGEVVLDSNLAGDLAEVADIEISVSGKVSVKDAHVLEVTLSDDENATLEVSGNVKIDSVELGADKMITVGGELKSYAEINVVAVSGKTAIATGYSQYNSNAGYAKKPTCFKAVGDGAGSCYVALNAAGEVVMGEDVPDLFWSVRYAGSDEYVNVDDYGISFKYGEKIVTGVNLNYDVDNSVIASDSQYKDVYRDLSNNAIGSHVVTIEYDGVTYAFQIYIEPISLKDADIKIINDAGFVVDDNGFNFTGAQIKPKVVATIGGFGLTETEDYVLTYRNNLNISDKAYVCVTGANNYCDTVELRFTISIGDSMSYVVQWEYYDTVRGEWAIGNANFDYNGENQSGHVRAKLMVENQAGDFIDYVEYVYAAGEGTTDVNRSSMNLVFSVDTVEATFVHAKSYNVTIVGIGNAGIDERDKVGEATINPIALDITQADFDNQAGVWALHFENGKATLINGADIAHIAGVNAELNDAYAFYRGTDPLTLSLNEDFVIGKLGLLKNYIVAASNIAYTPTIVTDAQAGIVNEYNSTVTLTFSDDFTFEDGGNQLTLEKTWYVVTESNSVSATETEKTSFDWMYGDRNFISTAYAYRPNHGLVAYYTFVKLVETEDGVEEEIVDKFMADFSADSVAYYDVDGDGNVASEISTSIYNLYGYMYELAAGNYTLRIDIPAYQSRDDAYNVAYAAATKNIDVVVRTASLTTGSGNNVTWASEIIYNIPDRLVTYNGETNNTPLMVINYKGRTLVQNVDYVLTSANLNATNGQTAKLTIQGIGNFAGEITLDNAFTILRATNTWNRIPSIQSWKYGDFDAAINVITARPSFIANDGDMMFMIATDENGNNIIAGLDAIVLNNGVVSDEVAELLEGLEYGSYYLIATVRESDNYDAMSATVGFSVLQGVNSWKETLKVQTWVYGKYNAESNIPTAVARYGKANFIVTDLDGETVYYDSAKGIDNLAKANVGKYLLTVKVESTDNYMELTDYLVFEVFEKPGLPWWAILLIVVGVLGVVAAVLYILHEKGVLQMLTGRAIIAMRTRATIDATIAAVRANKIAEAAKKSLADAEEREQAEAAANAAEATANADDAQ